MPAPRASVGCSATTKVVLNVVRLEGPVTLAASPTSAESIACTAADATTYLVNVTVAGGGAGVDGSAVTWSSPAGESICTRKPLVADAPKTATIECSLSGAAGDTLVTFEVKDQAGGHLVPAGQCPKLVNSPENPAPVWGHASAQQAPLMFAATKPLPNTCPRFGFSEPRHSQGKRWPPQSAT